jgi:hypothetical protein
MGVIGDKMALCNAKRGITPADRQFHQLDHSDFLQISESLKNKALFTGPATSVSPDT